MRGGNQASLEHGCSRRLGTSPDRASFPWSRACRRGWKERSHSIRDRGFPHRGIHPSSFGSGDLSQGGGIECRREVNAGLGHAGATRRRRRD